MWQSYFKDKKVSIPGGAGFVGSHLAEMLRPVAAEISIPRVEDGIDCHLRVDLRNVGHPGHFVDDVYLDHEKRGVPCEVADNHHR